MKAVKSERGFIHIIHLNHANEPVEKRLISESSAIGDYDDSLRKPGSSYLWIGEDHHLNREEVKELIERMQYWLDHKRLKLK